MKIYLLKIVISIDKIRLGIVDLVTLPKKEIQSLI